MSPNAASVVQVTMKEMSDNQPTDEFNFSDTTKEIAGRGGGTLRYFGTVSHQNQNAFHTFDAFFKRLEREEKPAARIIELGTGCGGLSIFLQIYALTQGIDFITYDNEPYNPELFPVLHMELFRRLGIDLRAKDIFEEEEEISGEIQKKGVTVLLCDACKAREYNLFAPYLKWGDYILAHDFAPDRDYWAEHMYDKVWSFCHMIDADIAEAAKKYNLVPFMADEFLQAAWSCRKKNMFKPVEQTE